MFLSIIIVSWNVKEKLRENLIALYQSEGDLSFEVFAVDNDSADGTAEMVRRDFPRVNLIANRENLGFAKACNQGIKLAKGEYILLLNPDMKVFPDTLANMIVWMNENPQTWVAGCKLENENGELVRHVRHFPRFWDQLAIVLKLPHLLPKALDKYLRVDFDYSAPAKVDSIRGAFFMIRKEAMDKVGLLDERFFIWFEEVDYCLRVKKAGGETWYTPVAACVDYVGESFKQVKRGIAQKYFRDSMLKYFRKCKPAWQYWLLKSAWPIGSVIAEIGEFINFKSRAKT